MELFRERFFKTVIVLLGLYITIGVALAIVYAVSQLGYVIEGLPEYIAFIGACIFVLWHIWEFVNWLFLEPLKASFKSKLP